MCVSNSILGMQYVSWRNDEIVENTKRQQGHRAQREPKSDKNFAVARWPGGD